MHNAREAGDKMADPSKGSLIFAPYRALGFCCNDVPLRVYARGDSFLVATAVGKSHHVYNVSSGKGSSSEESGQHFTLLAIPMQTALSMSYCTLQKNACGPVLANS